MSRMFEKRHSPRIDVDLPVVLRHQGRFIEATMQNLSCGGIYITTNDVDIDDATPVEVIFDLDASRRDVSLMGKIRRVESCKGKTGIGIQFSNLFSGSHKVVQDYLRKNLT